MANIKFSAFTQKVAQADVDFLVGYTGADNVRIAPSTLGDGIYLPLAGGTMAGNIAMSTNNITLADDAQIQLGNLSGGDMKLYHVSGVGSYVLNKTDDLRIINQSDNGDIIFETDNGSGSTAVYFFLDGGQSETDDLITNWPDNSKATFGTSRDLKIFHDAGNSYINEEGTGNLYIQADSQIRLGSITGTEKYARFNLNGILGQDQIFI